MCVYDVAEDGKTTTQLRAHVRRLVKEADDLKSVLLSLAMAPNRASAALWASELEKNGFINHSADEVRKALAVSSQSAPSQGAYSYLHQDPAGPTPGLPDGDSFGTPTSEHFNGPTQNIAASSYEGSSREDRQAQPSRSTGQSANNLRSREQSQAAINYCPEPTADGVGPMVPPTMSIEAASSASSTLQKFGYDCAYYRRIKRELLQNGFSEVQIFGRTEIDVDTLLLCFLDPQDDQPVSTWCSRTVNKLLPTSPLPVRLASTWALTKLMRVGASTKHALIIKTNYRLVSYMADGREYEGEPRLADATIGRAANVSIRSAHRSHPVVCQSFIVREFDINTQQASGTPTTIRASP